MELLDFRIQLYDFKERDDKPKTTPRSKIDPNLPPKKMYSFTLAWEGRLHGADGDAPTSYLGAEHKGCLFSVYNDQLCWSFPKTRTFRGLMIEPTKANTGLTALIMSYLSKTEFATKILAANETWKAARIPDPEEGLGKEKSNDILEIR